MTNSQRLATVRAHLRRWIQSTYTSEIGGENPAGEIGILSESILIREGYYVGRNFKIGTGESEIRATWFMEPDEIKVRQLDGEIIVVFSSNEIIGEQPAEIIATSEMSEQESVANDMVTVVDESADDRVQDDRSTERSAEPAVSSDREVAAVVDETPATIPISGQEVAAVSEPADVDANEEAAAELAAAEAESSQSERTEQSGQSVDTGRDDDLSKAA